MQNADAFGLFFHTRGCPLSLSDNHRALPRQAIDDIGTLIAALSKEMTPGWAPLGSLLGWTRLLGGLGGPGIPGNMYDRPSCKMSNEGNRDGRLGVRRSQPLEELLAIYAAPQHKATCFHSKESQDEQAQES